jgi:ribosomal-protein-alanine N-acetyltransferase
MKAQPTIETPRLLLRPFTVADAPEVQRLAGDREIASTMLHVPHPYEGMAEQWIGTHQEHYERGEAVNFALVLRATNGLVGAMSLQLNQPHSHAELGYWIGKPFWNQGYCTEAARAVVHYGFAVLGLHRVYATYLTRNPASGRVMQKIGMSYEGCLKQHVKKWGVFEDQAFYGILRSGWASQNQGGDPA